MLEEIRIRGLGVIDDAHLELGPGLTVVTGETGAGKTMVLTGLGLLMGGRADGGAVRAGAERAVVEGRVRVDADGPVAARVQEAGADIDDGDLLMSRTVQPEGRSRAHVGGRSVPANLLTELAQDLIAVHGQSDQQRLLKTSRQRQALDKFGGEAVAVPFNAYAEKYRRLQDVTKNLSEITAQARERAQEADLLRLGLAEVEAVDPKPGEDAALRDEGERLAHADGLRTAAETAHEALSADDVNPDQPDVLTLLAHARQALDTEREHDPEIAGLSDRLAEATYVLADLTADLASYASGVDVDPGRLSEVNERRSTIAGLQRKYGETIDDVLAWAETGSKRLLELDSDDDRIEELTRERDELTTEVTRLAGELTHARQDAAKRLSEAVTVELAALAMPHASVVVDVRPRDDFGPNGADEIEMLFSSHAGAQPRPLDRGASGGELSRLMLAIEVVFAGTDPVPTFVFDEVDAGVGGKAAVEVGRRLAMLARHAQVLVVTHLPQVAAFADRHLKVVKSQDGSVTSSGVEALDSSARVNELSRMLAGLEGSSTAQAHAIELLATASSAKSGDNKETDGAAPDTAEQ